MLRLVQTVPLAFFDPGYSLPFSSTSENFKFDRAGLEAFVGKMWNNGDPNEPARRIEGYYCNPGYFASVTLDPTNPAHISMYPQVWQGGYAIVDGGEEGSGDNISYWTFDNTIQATQNAPLNKFNFTAITTPNIVFGPQVFAPPAGDLTPERVVATYSLFFYNPTVNPPPLSNINCVCKVHINGADFIGFGIQQGGDDPTAQWGPLAWYAGVTSGILNNAFFDISRGAIQNYMYFPATNGTNRPYSALAEFTMLQPQTVDYNFRNGSISQVTFDDPVLQASLEANDFAELSCTRNGWTAVLEADDYAYPGSKWALMYLSYDMQQYYMLKIDPNAVAKAILSNPLRVPSFKIDAGGIAWLLDSTTGDLATSFSLDIPQPAIVGPVPPATFSLPCFDPCDPDLWASQIQDGYKAPTLGS